MNHKKILQIKQRELIVENTVDNYDCQQEKDGTKFRLRFTG